MREGGKWRGMGKACWDVIPRVQPFSQISLGFSRVMRKLTSGMRVILCIPQPKLDTRCGIAVFLGPSSWRRSRAIPIGKSGQCFLGAGQWACSPYKKSEKGAEPPSPTVVAAGRAVRTAEEEAVWKTMRQEMTGQQKQDRNRRQRRDYGAKTVWGAVWAVVSLIVGG